MDSNWFYAMTSPSRHSRSSWHSTPDAATVGTTSSLRSRIRLKTSWHTKSLFRCQLCSHHCYCRVLHPGDDPHSNHHGLQLLELHRSTPDLEGTSSIGPPARWCSHDHRLVPHLDWPGRPGRLRLHLSSFPKDHLGVPTMGHSARPTWPRAAGSATSDSF